MAKKRDTGSSAKRNAVERQTEKPKVNPELEGFDIQINSFGEIKTTFDIDKINAFLNQNVDDKKLRDREDVPGIKKKRKKE
jgi:hypothetical protein